MIKHIVMWNLKEDVDIKATRDTIKSRLEGLLGKIETLKFVEVGFNHNPSELARDITLYTEFDDQEGLDAYQAHPAHVEAGTYVGSVTKDRIVSDYEI